jgi:hypothetical protein
MIFMTCVIHKCERRAAIDDLQKMYQDVSIENSRDFDFGIVRCVASRLFFMQMHS